VDATDRPQVPAGPPLAVGRPSSSVVTAGPATEWSLDAMPSALMPSALMPSALMPSALLPADLPTTGQPAVSEPLRPLTPIERDFGGTDHPSLPIPGTGIRRSLPIPPIPGLDGGRDDAHRDDAPRDDGRPAHPGGSTRAGGRATRTATHARRRLPRPLLAVLVLLGVVIAGYGGVYLRADRSMARVDALVTDGPEVLAPQLQDSAQTYLVVGTGLPGRSGPASVSTLLAHVADDGKRAVLVTVPPTALADTPACRAKDGSVRSPAIEPFAAALLDGGPSCLVRSVQQLSGLRVDHYVGVDLGALPGLVDALSGVAVCLPGTAVADTALPAGPNELSGEQITGLLAPGTAGSDVTGTTAAQREERVLAATLNSALSPGTLASPLTLTRLLGSVGAAFTLDADTTLGDVRALGAALGGSAVQRTGVPVSRIGYLPAGSDQALTLIDATAARSLFDSVIDDGRLPEAGPPAETAVPDPATAPGSTTVTVPPAGVTVDVLDATGAHRGSDVAAALTAAGFRTGAIGTEPAAVDQTVVRYGPAAAEPARTVAAAVPGAVLVQTDQVGSAVQLVLGPGQPTVTPVAVGAPVPTEAVPAPAPDGDTAPCG
jgi:anionic cell wall polymer biosynthesis LytR-Cps2A-Psr (LCP) family protein